MKHVLVNYIYTIAIDVEDDVTEDDDIVLEKADEQFEKMFPHTPVELFAVETEPWG